MCKYSSEKEQRPYLWMSILINQSVKILRLIFRFCHFCVKWLLRLYSTELFYAMLNKVFINNFISYYTVQSHLDFYNNILYVTIKWVWLFLINLYMIALHPFLYPEVIYTYTLFYIICNQGYNIGNDYSLHFAYWKACLNHSAIYNN